VETKRPNALNIAIAGIFCFLSIAAGTVANRAYGQGEKFDGTYQGMQALDESASAGNYSQCLKGPFKRRLVVKGGTATYTYNPTYQGQVAAVVSADGDVSGTAADSGGVAISGRIDGGDFTGEVWSLYCTYSVKLKRVP
jgi:hypothetical protein